ncbi:DUF4231 domain-containing protein [Nitrosomonas sp. Nm34]|uniref:DUF4231 domain-containing protein n=1 Tax=Nitrosomonas sp. Nm34 TaxID=1881055 RepID=UPI000B823054|nr:DUF4231 domain-containing protein [Nitrosomonas sp. Nm34]
MMSILECVADRQAIWSETANALKSATDRARYSTFIASFLGALFAAFAVQQINPGIANYLAVLSAISLAFVTFITARWLNKDVLDRHSRVRIASEALKREAFLYATQTAPYHDPQTRDKILLDQKGEIENKVNDLLLFEQTAKGLGSCPRQDLSLNEYMEQRVEKQIKYYRDRSTRYNTYSQRLHTLEWMLSLIAAIIAALAASPLLNIDLAAITAVLTTLGGVVVSHLEATRFDKLIPIYRATANRLENIRLKTQIDKATSTDWVKECETVLAAENSAWMGLWIES